MAKAFFLSHSSDDERFVQEVASKLGKEGAGSTDGMLSQVSPSLHLIEG